MEETKTRAKYERKVFFGCLEELSEVLPKFDRSILLYYCKDGEVHQEYVEILASSLLNAGISSDKIYYDKWNRKTTIYQYEDIALRESEIAIIIGSPDLKKKCESDNEVGSYFTKQALSHMLKSEKVKIPVWFEGNFESNFPSIYHHIIGLSMVDDYFNGIFDLLICLYQLDPTDNEVKSTKERFNRIVQNNVLYDEFKIEELKQREEDIDDLRAILGL